MFQSKYTFEIIPNHHQTTLGVCIPTIWSPFHKGQIEGIESVQKFALRMCMKSWNLDYENLLINARIPTLSSRCTRASMMYVSFIQNCKNQTHFPNAPIVSRHIVHMHAIYTQQHYMTVYITHFLFCTVTHAWAKFSIPINYMQNNNIESECA